jgi:hypothetical protein
MFKPTSLFAFVVASHCACAGAAAPPATETPTRPPFKSVGCVDISKLTSQNTPADIFPGVRECIDEHAYEQAAGLYAVAGVYGRFDTLRVADASAHEVIPALRELVLGNLDPKIAAEFMAVIRKIGGSGLVRLCARVRALGPPTYYPTYMLAHGLSALTGQGGGLKSDFDRGAAWDSALTTFLNCPKVQ